MFFSYDSPFMRGLSRVADMIVVNVLFVLCCLPLLTYGAARTALYEIAFRWEEGDRVAGREFLRRFRQNLRPAFLPGLCMLGLGGLLAVNLLLCLRAGAPLFMLASTLLLCLLYLAFREQVFLYGARFVCSRREQLRSGAIMTAAALFRALAIGLLLGLPLLLAAWMPAVFLQALPLWLLIYYAAAVWPAARLMKKPYARIMEQLGAADEE